MAFNILKFLGFFLVFFASSVIGSNNVSQNRTCTGKPNENVNFNQNYRVLWGTDHLFILDGGKEVQLQLDELSGCGFRSISEYGSGSFSIRMKIPYTKSSGIIASFYLTSAPDNKPVVYHDELDFEFVGSDGLVQTNVFASDSGNREEKYQLWFDPTKDFHNYQIVWNQYQVVFLIDNVPIRIFKNNTKIGVNYLTNPMHLEASLWSADWAGSVDWADAPFKSNYRNFGIAGCVAKTSINHSVCSSPKLFWNRFALGPAQLHKYEQFRKTHIRYQYCWDRGENHPECHKHVN